MISSDSIRGYIDLIILSLLIDEDSYGYEISQRIAEISEGLYAMKETTLYSAVTRLEQRGLLSSYHGTVSGGRRRTYYQLTAAGREAYRERCAEWQLTKEVVDRFIRAPDAAT